jgi:GNAT superfamily N-acetyltransferase
MPIARTATIADLEPLLDLFRASEVSSAVETLAQARKIWDETLNQGSVTVFVSEAGAKVVATCMLITAPNLLRSGRRHAFLENVVTHPAFQGQGHGRAVVEAALSRAWTMDCYHVMLQSGRKDARVHRFYERCGLERGMRSAYVIRCPAQPH